MTISSWPLLVGVVLIAGLLAGFLGLLLGTLVAPRQIGLIFSLVVIPITFLGCVYYPWQQLGAIPWLKALTLLNPLVYVSEGLRAAMTPSLPHMPVAPSWPRLSCHGGAGVAEHPVVHRRVTG